MAITSAIVYTNPVGSSITVSQLDDSDRLIKTEVQERMEESIIDTAVATWANTTAKACKKGFPRIFVDDLAGKAGLTPLYDGKLFYATDGTNADSFDVYNGGWTPVPIGSSNLLANAVTTAKITDLNVTTGKLAAAAVHGWQTAVSNTTDDANATSTWICIGDGGGAGTRLTFTITPTSSSSVIMIWGSAHVSKATNGGPVGLRIRNTTDNVTLDEAESLAQGTIGDGTPVVQRISLMGTATGLVGDKTFELQFNSKNNNATAHVRGDVVASRFMAVDFKK